MIKKRMMIGFLITFLLFSIIFQSCCNAKKIENKYDENSKLGVKANSIEASNDLTGSGYDYVINSYNIDMIVKQDNTFDITERIEAYFNKPKHGISREIPLKNIFSLSLSPSYSFSFIILNSFGLKNRFFSSISSIFK